MEIRTFKHSPLLVLGITHLGGSAGQHHAARTEFML